MNWKISDNIKDLIHNIPSNSGIYLFYDDKGNIIYVGKAKNLDKRVSSYFNNSVKSEKTKHLVSKIKDIKYIITENENDALILENNYIKQYKPKYNILLKDDKTFPWIVVTDEEFPRIFFTRKFNEKYKYVFGPYTSVYSAKILYNLIKKIIPFRICNYDLTKSKIYDKKFKACLEYHLGNCLAPCINNQSFEDYNNNIGKIVQILKGELVDVENYLKKLMNDYVKNYEFEKANEIKTKIEIIKNYRANSVISNTKFSTIDVFYFIVKNSKIYYNYLKIINGNLVFNYNNFINNSSDDNINEIAATIINQLRQNFNSDSNIIITSNLPSLKFNNTKYIVPKKGEYFDLLNFGKNNLEEYIKRLDEQTKNEKNIFIGTKEILMKLKEKLNLKNYPQRIDCFDNSNIQGAYAVSSCVVFSNGIADKKEYRLFKVKTVTGPDDFATMKEVVYRRYKNLLLENKPIPDLIIIDGGKGQLNYAIEVLRELNVYDKCDIISIAKKNEEIYLPSSNKPIVIPHDEQISLFIRKIRDEAHRFGITFHRKLRSSDFLKSKIDNIKGIGDSTKTILNKNFKTIDEIKNCSIDSLTRLIGAKKANIVFSYFNKNKD